MTKSQMIELIFNEQRDEFGADLSNPKVREYAELLTEDLNRKGCIPETYPGNECRSCGSCVDGRCPLEDWEERHPEYKDDELTKKIKALETELYGWHRPETHRTELLPQMTVEEAIAKLQTMPKDAVVEVCNVKIPLA